MASRSRRRFRRAWAERPPPAPFTPPWSGWSERICCLLAAGVRLRCEEAAPSVSTRSRPRDANAFSSGISDCGLDRRGGAIRFYKSSDIRPHRASADHRLPREGASPRGKHPALGSSGIFDGALWLAQHAHGRCIRGIHALLSLPILVRPKNSRNRSLRPLDQFHRALRKQSSCFDGLTIFGFRTQEA